MLSLTVECVYCEKAFQRGRHEHKVGPSRERHARTHTAEHVHGCGAEAHENEAHDPAVERATCVPRKYFFVPKSTFGKF